MVRLDARPLFPEDMTIFHLGLSVVITGIMLFIYIVRKWFQAKMDADEAREEYLRVYAWEKETPVKPLNPLDEIPLDDKKFYFDGWEDEDVKVEEKEYIATKGGKSITIPVKEIEVKEGVEARDREILARGHRDAGDRDEKAMTEKGKKKRKKRMNIGPGQGGGG